MRTWLKSLVLVLLSVSTVHATVFIGRFGARGTDAFLPDSWSPYVRALYLLNNSSGDTADSSGHGWTLTNTNTVTSDTTNYREPFYATEGRAASFASASNEVYTCLDATCGGTAGLDFDAATNATYGCWYRPTSSATEQHVLTKISGFNGYELSRQTSTAMRCSIGDGTTVNTDGATNLANNSWRHAVCVATGSAHLIYADGAQDGTTSSSRLPGGNATSFDISSTNTSKDVEGQIDECFVDDIAWGAESICRACAIGIGGDDDNAFFTEARGECDPEFPYNYKTCASNSDCNSPFGVCTTASSEDNCAGTNCCMGYKNLYCGGCDLPDCDQGAPLGATAVYPTDWTSSLRAVYRFEDSPGLLVDSTAVTGDLTNNGTVVNQSTEFREGAEAAQFAQASNQSFSCTDAACGGTSKSDGDGATPMTWGCWYRVTGIPSPTNVSQIFMQKGPVGSTGWVLRRTTQNKQQCTWSEGTSVSLTATNAQRTFDSVWAHGICTANGTNGRMYKNGSQIQSNATASLPANATGDLILNHTTAAQDWSGELDECVIDDIAWGPQTVCRVCSLGVDGELGECAANVPTDYKVCSTNADCNGGAGVCGGDGRCTGYRTTRCGSCTLPACNEAAPSTS